MTPHSLLLSSWKGGRERNTSVKRKRERERNKPEENQVSETRGSSGGGGRGELDGTVVPQRVPKKGREIM